MLYANNALLSRTPTEGKNLDERKTSDSQIVVWNHLSCA